METIDLEPLQGAHLTVEILDLDARGIHVAEYLTELPPRKLLEERLHKAIESARNRIAPSKLGGPR